MRRTMPQGAKTVVRQADHDHGYMVPDMVPEPDTEPDESG